MAPFPGQPVGVPWPTTSWPSGPRAAGTMAAGIDRAALDGAIERLMAQPTDLGLTLALFVVHRGVVVAEAYGPETDASTTLISWSMAKSITHAVVGILVGEGRICLDDPAPVPEWADDERRSITVRHLIEMSSGLRFVEDYVDDSVSDVIEMLFGSGASDHAAYAASFPLEHEPGTVWSYASGTTNIVARIAGEIVGGGREGMERFLRERLFDPIGMASAAPKFDEVGTFVGSSYVYATAADFARFGYLYLREGTWDGRRVLPEGWAASARTPVAAPIPDGERHGYAQHWWRWFRSDDTFSANGFETQRTIVSPARDVVLVRLGKTPAEFGPNVDGELQRILEAFPVLRDAPD